MPFDFEAYKKERDTNFAVDPVSPVKKKFDLGSYYDDLNVELAKPAEVQVAPPAPIKAPSRIPGALMDAAKSPFKLAKTIPSVLGGLKNAAGDLSHEMADFPAKVAAPVTGWLGEKAGQALGLVVGSVTGMQLGSLTSKSDGIQRLKDAFSQAKKTGLETAKAGGEMGRGGAEMFPRLAQTAIDVGRYGIKDMAIKGNEEKWMNMAAERFMQNYNTEIPYITGKAEPITIDQAKNYLVTGNFEGNNENIDKDEIVNAWISSLIPIGLDLYFAAQIATNAFTNYQKNKPFHQKGKISKIEYTDFQNGIIEQYKNGKINIKSIAPDPNTNLNMLKEDLSPTIAQRLASPVSRQFDKISRVRFGTNVDPTGRLQTSVSDLAKTQQTNIVDQKVVDPIFVKSRLNDMSMKMDWYKVKPEVGKEIAAINPSNMDSPGKFFTEVARVLKKHEVATKPNIEALVQTTKDMFMLEKNPDIAATIYKAAKEIDLNKIPVAIKPPAKTVVPPIRPASVIKPTEAIAPPKQIERTTPEVGTGRPIDLSDIPRQSAIVPKKTDPETVYRRISEAPDAPTGVVDIAKEAETVEDFRDAIVGVARDRVEIDDYVEPVSLAQPEMYSLADEIDEQYPNWEESLADQLKISDEAAADIWNKQPLVIDSVTGEIISGQGRLLEAIDKDSPNDVISIPAIKVAKSAKVKEPTQNQIKISDIYKAAKRQGSLFTPARVKDQSVKVYRGVAQTPTPTRGVAVRKKISLPKKEVKAPIKPAVDGELAKVLRGTKGMTADDIMKKHPNIQLKKDVSAKDVHGRKVIIPEGEKLTPYELKDGKILLQDGETYLVSKNQFQNIIKSLAPEIKTSGKMFAPVAKPRPATPVIKSSVFPERLAGRINMMREGEMSPTRGSDFSLSKEKPSRETYMIGGFEKIIKETDPAKVELKIFEEVKNLVKKYATNIGEGYLPRGAAGVFYHSSNNLRVKGMNHVSLAAHEITHAIDKKYSITKKILSDVSGYSRDGKPIYPSKTSGVRKDLTDIYLEYYPRARKNHDLRKRMAEGYATLVEHYTMIPSTMEAKYPGLVKEFLKPGGKYHSPITEEMLNDLRDIVSRYQDLTPLEKIGSRITSKKVNVNKDDFLTFAQKLKTEIADEIYPIEVLAKKTGTHFTADDPSLSLRQINNTANIFLKNLIEKDGYWAWRNGKFLKLHDFNWGTLVDRLKSEKTTDNFAYWLVSRNEHFTFKEMDTVKKKAEMLNEAIQSLGGRAEAREYSDGVKLLAEFDTTIAKYRELKSILDNDGFTRKEIEEAYFSGKETFKDLEDMYDTLSGEDLDFLHNQEVGLLSNKEYGRLKAREGYAPMKRQFYDEIIGKEQAITTGIKLGGTKVSSMIKRRGSTRTVLNPLYSSIRTHAEVLQKGMKQIVYNKVAKALMRQPQLGIAQKLQLQAVPDKSGMISFPQEKDPNVIMARINGKRTPFLVDKTIKRTLDEVLSVDNINILEELLMFSSRFFTKGTTGTFAPFAITNTIMDQPIMAAQTMNKATPVISQLKTLIAKLDKNNLDHQAIIDYLALGGAKQTIVGWRDMDARDLFNAVRKEENGIRRAMEALVSGADILAFPAKWSEILSRASEYRLARAAGKSQLVALEQAGRVTTPFHHIGRLGKGQFGKTAVKSIPYLNSNIQGLVQATETIGTPEGRKRYLFVALAVTASLMAGMASVIKFGTKEQQDQYADLKPEELGQYIWYPLPSGKGLGKLRVPELIATPGVLINMKMADNLLKTDYSAKEYIKAATAWIPTQVNFTEPLKAALSWIPQLLKPGIMVAFNVKDYPNIAPLESWSQQRKEPEFRYTDATSLVAKAIGKEFGLSPIKIDALVYGYASRSMGYLMGKPGVYNPMSVLTKDYYFESGRKVQSYYNLKGENDQKYDTFINNRREIEKIKDKEKLIELIKDNKEMLDTRAKIKYIDMNLKIYGEIDIEKEPTKETVIRTIILDALDDL